MGKSWRNALFSSLQHPSFKCVVTQIKQYFCLGKDTKVCHSGLQQESWVSLPSFFLLPVIQGSQAWHCFRGSEQTGCSGLWIPLPNNSPSAPIQLMERFHLVSLFECMSLKWREKCTEALSWFSSLKYLLWQYQQANCGLVLGRKTIHVITLCTQLSQSPSCEITAAFFFREISSSWEGCLSVDEEQEKNSTFQGWLRMCVSGCDKLSVQGGGQPRAAKSPCPCIGGPPRLMQPILGKAGKRACDPLGFLPLSILTWCLSSTLSLAGDVPFLWDLSWGESGTWDVW